MKFVLLLVILHLISANPQMIFFRISNVISYICWFRIDLFVIKIWQSAGKPGTIDLDNVCILQTWICVWF